MASVSPPAGLSRQPDQEGSKENTAPTSTSPQLKVTDYDSEELDRDPGLIIRSTPFTLLFVGPLGS